MTLRLGKLPPDPSRLTLHLGVHLTTAAPPPPARDWLSKVPRWSMYANDRYGDCVWAAMGHAIKAWTTYAGKPVSVPQAALLQGYSDVTGFNPRDPSTDQGTVWQDALGYWRSHGIAGHKILAFAKINHRDPAELQTAINLFGLSLVGIQFPAVAMGQFHAGRPWTIVPGSDRIEGGHALHVGAYAPHRMDCTTWGRRQQMSQGFSDRYMDEAWCVITPEWLTSVGRTPQGLDLQGLGESLAQLTGERNPFA